MSNNNMTVVYVDLSTYDEIEELLYAGVGAANIFHHRVTKCIWFGQIPIRLRNQGTADYDQTFTTTQPRNGDYGAYTWARLTTNAITFSDPAAAVAAGYQIGLVPDFGHAVFKEVSFLVNEVPLHQTKQASIFLDHEAHHNVDESHWDNYQFMIGNRAELVGDGTNLLTPDPTSGVAVPAAVIDVPMWIFYMKNGAAFPHSCVPYADIKWEFTLRPFERLVQVRGGSLSTVVGALTTASTRLNKFELWTNYIVTTQDMRAQMGRVPRQMLLEQVQETTQALSTSQDTSIDLRFAYSMKWLTWVAQNTTRAGDLIRVGATGALTAGYEHTNYTDALGLDPISATTIKYENATRMDSMPSDYWGNIVPFFHFNRSPKKNGWHNWAIAYFGSAYNPSGAVQVSRMYNMSAILTLDSAAASGYQTSAGASVASTFRAVFIAYVNQIVLFSGGGILLEYH